MKNEFIICFGVAFLAFYFTHLAMYFTAKKSSKKSGLCPIWLMVKIFKETIPCTIAINSHLYYKLKNDYEISYHASMVSLNNNIYVLDPLSYLIFPNVMLCKWIVSKRSSHMDCFN